MANKINYSYNMVHDASASLIHKIKESNYEPEVIVPLIRGGLVPGTIISHAMNKDIYTLDISLRDRPQQDASLEILDLYHKLKYFKKILFLDDICDSGKTFEYIKKEWNYFSSSRVDWDNNVKFACLQKRYTSTFNPDYYAHYLEHDDWIIYPWEVC